VVKKSVVKNPKSAIRHPKLTAFTLIELLVVVAVIAVLISILVPSLQDAKDQAVQVTCMSNLKQVYMAYLYYAQDNDNELPRKNVNAYHPHHIGAGQASYFSGNPNGYYHPKVFLCPAVVNLPEVKENLLNSKGFYNQPSYWPSVHIWAQETPTSIYTKKLSDPVLSYSGGGPRRIAPSEAAMLAESRFGRPNQGVPGYGFWDYHWLWTPDRFGWYHSNGTACNLPFVDGHIEPMSIETFPYPYIP
jgi:prepilin-type N-terminal cleavage/methylation domain-containing protein